jgi:hypothetical protein
VYPLKFLPEKAKFCLFLEMQGPSPSGPPVWNTTALIINDCGCTMHISRFWKWRAIQNDKRNLAWPWVTFLLLLTQWVFGCSSILFKCRWTSLVVQYQIPITPVNYKCHLCSKELNLSRSSSQCLRHASWKTWNRKALIQFFFQIRESQQDHSWSSSTLPSSDC